MKRHVSVNVYLVTNVIGSGEKISDESLSNKKIKFEKNNWIYV